MFGIWVRGNYRIIDNHNLGPMMSGFSLFSALSQVIMDNSPHVSQFQFYQFSNEGIKFDFLFFRVVYMH